MDSDANTTVGADIVCAGNYKLRSTKITSNTGLPLLLLHDRMHNVTLSSSLHVRYQQSTGTSCWPCPDQTREIEERQPLLAGVCG